MKRIFNFIFVATALDLAVCVTPVTAQFLVIDESSISCTNAGCELQFAGNSVFEAFSISASCVDSNDHNRWIGQISGSGTIDSTGDCCENDDLVGDITGDWDNSSVWADAWANNETAGNQNEAIGGWDCNTGEFVEGGGPELCSSQTTWWVVHASGTGFPPNQ
jgi:hypothetical protein